MKLFELNTNHDVHRGSFAYANIRREAPGVESLVQRTKGGVWWTEIKGRDAGIESFETVGILFDLVSKSQILKLFECRSFARNPRATGTSGKGTSSMSKLNYYTVQDNLQIKTFKRCHTVREDVDRTVTE